MNNSDKKKIFKITETITKTKLNFVIILLFKVKYLFNIHDFKNQYQIQLFKLSGLNLLINFDINKHYFECYLIENG